MNSILAAFVEATIKKVNNRDCKECPHFSIADGVPTCGYDIHADSADQECRLVVQAMLR